MFDSGVGGLTTARAIIDLLPQESISYLGDTSHAPYGPQPAAAIRRHALAATDTLVASGIKLLVIACNSAAAAGVTDLARERYPIPVLEVITPAVRRALAVSRADRIGVIATVATVDSLAYPRAFEQFRDRPVQVWQQACPSFVDFVERGITSGRQLTGLTQAYLDPLQRADIDTLVLGCTHYPLLAGVLQYVLGEQVTLVSSSEETARDVFRVLTEAEVLAPPEQQPVREFNATGDGDAFRRLGRRLLGPEVAAVPW